MRPTIPPRFISRLRISIYAFFVRWRRMTIESTNKPAIPVPTVRSNSQGERL